MFYSFLKKPFGYFNLKRALALFLFLSLSLFGMLYGLWKLPYSLSSVSFIEQEDLIGAGEPTPNFRIGSLEWDVDYYRDSPDLQIFRDFYLQNCSGTNGLEAADCVADRLREKIPFGDPGMDVFNAGYSPADSFRKNLSGEPGHCVTYSAFTANILLSVGIPARLVQIFPEKNSGHNIITVWDKNHGWVAFDPLNGYVLRRHDKLLAAFEALNSDNFDFSVYEKDQGRKSYLTDFYLHKENFQGTILYVEPWLYTRTGKKQSAPYFRAAFMAIGNHRPELGDLQEALRIGIAINLALLVVLLFGIILNFRGKTGFGKSHSLSSWI